MSQEIAFITGIVCGGFIGFYIAFVAYHSKYTEQHSTKEDNRANK